MVGMKKYPNQTSRDGKIQRVGWKIHWMGLTVDQTSWKMIELEVMTIEVTKKGTHRGNKKVQPQQISEQIISELWTTSSGLWRREGGRENI